MTRIFFDTMSTGPGLLLHTSAGTLARGNVDTAVALSAPHDPLRPTRHTAGRYLACGPVTPSGAAASVKSGMGRTPFRLRRTPDHPRQAAIACPRKPTQPGDR
jgi:hypothetical protein